MYYDEMHNAERIQAFKNRNKSQYFIFQYLFEQTGLFSWMNF